MKNYLEKQWPLFILLILAILTRVWFLSYPSEVVFDEVHFGKFISAYFTGQYYFDIHPPLGKLMIAGFTQLFGFQGNFDFSRIGETLDAYNLFILRFLPALFGVLFVLLIYELILVMGACRKIAFLGAFLVLFDNAFLVESKFILVDMFLLFFGFLSLYFFILAKRETLFGWQILFYLFSGISAGLSFSIKWTGLSFLGIILFFGFLDVLKNFKIKDFLAKFTVLIIIPFLVYVSFFTIHFGFLPKSGPGNAFMSPGFQRTLQGNSISPEVKPISFWQKFIELNKVMYKASASLKATHPNASLWYEWPLMKKPIWYWTKSFDGKVANIYLLGNPAVWWLTILSLFLVLLTLFFKKFRNKFSPLIYILIFGFLINLLPFIFIGRVTFLYHYLPSLTFGILILALFLDKKFKNLPQKKEKPYRLKKLLKQRELIQKPEFLTFPNIYHFLFYFGFLILVFLVFIVLAPLSYGFPVSTKVNQIYNILIKFLS